jgi:hypothetical protein
MKATPNDTKSITVTSGAARIQSNSGLYNYNTIAQAFPPSTTEPISLDNRRLPFRNGGGAPLSAVHGDLLLSAGHGIVLQAPASRIESQHTQAIVTIESPVIVPASPAVSTEDRITEIPSDSPTLQTCLASRQDWSDLHHQLHIANYTRASERHELLSTIQQKVTAPVGSSFSNYWRKQAAWNGYDRAASVIACSDYSRREDFVHCGYSTFSCQDRLFCPRCCYNRLARRVLDEFGNSFGADGAVYYIVLSLSRDRDDKHRLKFKDIGDDEFHGLNHRGASAPFTEVVNAGAYGVEFAVGDDLLQCRLLWQFMTEAIREFTGNKRGSLFSGVVGSPELAVQFQPLRVLPHANYLCWAPGFSVAGARELRSFIRTKMRDCRLLEAGLYPSVACYRLRVADGLRRVVNYIFKPIDLASAYSRAAERVNYTPADMECLNRDVNSFLKNVPDVFWRLNRVSRYGRCSASHRSYIGEVSAYRQAEREAAAERRANSVTPRSTSKLHPITRWQLHYLEMVDHPPGPRISRFQQWRFRNEQVPTRPH